MSPHRLPRSLLWKEVRSLVPLLPALVAIEVGCWLFLGKLLRSPATLPSSWPTVEEWAAGSLVLWGLLLGIALWGLEREADTYSLLSSLPIGPWRIIQAKILTSSLVLALVVLGRWAVLGTPLVPTAGAALRWLALSVALAWLAGAWLGTTPRPFGVGLALGLGLWLGTQSAPGVSRLAGEAPSSPERPTEIWPEALLLGLVLLLATRGVRGLRGQLAGAGPTEGLGVPRGRFFPERPHREGLRPHRALRRTLGWLERNLLAPSWIVALVFPVLLLLWPRARDLPWLFFFPIPWIAAWHASGIVTREERSGNDFFLQSLPIPRPRIYGRRLVAALLLGPLLILESTGLAILCTWLGVSDPLWQPATLIPTMVVLSLGLATTATLLAAALTPWIPQRSLVVALSGVHLVLLVLVGDDLGGLTNPATVVLLLLPHLTATLWSLLGRLPFDGAPRRARWAMLTLVGFWVLLLALGR